MTKAATLPLLDRAAREVGHLTVTCLRDGEIWRGTPALLDLRGTEVDPGPAARVQLLEEITYAIEITGNAARTVERLEPVEHFSSTVDLRSIWFAPKRSTGTITLEVWFDDGTSGRCDIEVRSRKLNYLSEYRSMIRRIAEEAAELVQSAFASSTLQAFRPDPSTDPLTTYQRFAFVQSLLESEEIDDALHQIERRPHHDYRTVSRRIDPTRGLQATSQMVRELLAAGPRQAAVRPIASLRSVPREVSEHSHITTYDTIPNRFVRYVLTRWLTIVAEVSEALERTPTADSGVASTKRGRREALALSEKLQRALMVPALQEAGRLDTFPQSNQVLQSRVGYRTIFEAFLLAEAASNVSWEAGNSLFRAGQRNVAELYEYWVFLELARILETLPDLQVDKRALLTSAGNGLSLNLRRDGSTVVRARAQRQGVAVRIELWFNRSFVRSKDDRNSTWSLRLCPDCSRRISPERPTLNADTWIHFDAKYRLQRLDADLIDDTDLPAAAAPSDRAPPDTLTKMHAYRDAIRQTAGAYVLYPGSSEAENKKYPRYHEVLPGIGAFVLRPSDDGHASSASAGKLAAFLEDVIDHVAAQGTAAERARYWTDASYGDPTVRRFPYRRGLDRPPADTSIVLAFVKSSDHLHWIRTNRRYVMRADSTRRGAVTVGSAELAAQYVLLYDEAASIVELWASTSDVTVHSKQQLEDEGYPDPGGEHYFCLHLEPVETPELAPLAVREAARVGRERSEWAAPRATTWAELMDRVSDLPTM